MPEEHTDIRVELATLKQELENVNSIQGRLDTAIEKLTDVSTSIKQMLAVHEEKLSKQEEIDKAIFNLLESRRVESDSKFEDIHGRLNKSVENLREEVELSEKRLMCEIKTLASNLDGRIGVFEKYRYLLIGAAIIIGLSMPQILQILKIVS